MAHQWMMVEVIGYDDNEWPILATYNGKPWVVPPFFVLHPLPAPDPITERQRYALRMARQWAEKVASYPGKDMSAEGVRLRDAVVRMHDLDIDDQHQALRDAVVEAAMNSDAAALCVAVLNLRAAMTPPDPVASAVLDVLYRNGVENPDILASELLAALEAARKVGK